jgi:primase-polymerase (primpol)-like protein
VGSNTEAKPSTHQADLAKLPRALAPLIERPQWAVWRWTQKPDGSWQKPPFMATQPERHASTTDPSTWSDYATALTTVQAKHADGITYILTKDDPFAAVDLDHCRCTITNSIDVWAQNWLDTGRNTYQEVTPSGEGCRIWGFADGEPLNRKFTLEIDGKTIAAELFRCTNKALTIEQRQRVRQRRLPLQH